MTCTNSGADALCILAGKPPPDLLVLDLIMPLLDGRDVLKALGPTAPPVVVISGSTLDCESPELARATRVLRKPFQQQQFLDAVNWALSGAGKKTETGP